MEAVIEKPTPTEAEQRLIVPGLRSGQYLCFFGMHVLTPAMFDILSAMLSATGKPRVSLSSPWRNWRSGSNTWPWSNGRRYDVGVKYGLFTAQLALALNGQDRDKVLAEMVNMLATREMFSVKGAGA